MICSIPSWIVDVVSFLLLVVMVIAVGVAIICTVEHADLKATSEKPIGAFDSKSLKRFLRTAFISGLIATGCLLLRALLRGNDLRDYFFSTVAIYKIFLLPSCWLLSYLYPSKRKKRVMKRKRLRKASW